MQSKAVQTDRCEENGIHPQATQAARAILVPDEILADLAERPSFDSLISKRQEVDAEINLLVDGDLK